MKLFCALVGAAGSAFPVVFATSQSVDDLKKAIKEKMPRTITCDADEVDLYLAKTGNAWLDSSTDDAKKLKKGEVTPAIEAMTNEDKELQGESGLRKVLLGMPTASTDQIHVLVVISAEVEQPALKKVKLSTVIAHLHLDLLSISCHCMHVILECNAHQPIVPKHATLRP